MLFFSASSRISECAILSFFHVVVDEGPRSRVEMVALSMTLPIPSEGNPSVADNVSDSSGPARVPAEPPDDLIYHHQATLRTSLRGLWASRDILYTLAERDIRAQYKQASLGLTWALLAPLA